MGKIIIILFLIGGLPTYGLGLYHLGKVLATKRKMLTKRAEHEEWLITQDRSNFLLNGKSGLLIIEPKPDVIEELVQAQKWLYQQNEQTSTKLL